jgi:hypothetical protein
VGFLILDLRFICNLVLGIWDLGMRICDGGPLESDQIILDTLIHFRHLTSLLRHEKLERGFEL